MADVPEIIRPRRVVAVDSIGRCRHKALRGRAAEAASPRRCLVAWLRRQTGEVPEWLKGTDCKSVGYAYVGSNPTLSTTAGPEALKRKASDRKVDNGFRANAMLTNKHRTEKCMAVFG